ncbi:hypothetical protein SAY86_022428 [Trapa natans]|uniref:Carboxypeptidase n=1 Tax=Trapa natans TaxID=22666 RepID=A0AAN7M5J1_TRANT|nr:hypothetical protein SAY86_022428 [Trapa natans]
MAPSASVISFFSLSIFLTLFSSWPAATSMKVSPRQQTAEWLIKSLNLSPRHAANIVGRGVTPDHRSPDDSSGIEEWGISLPVGLYAVKNASAPAPASVDNLGHSAGYFTLPNTKNARMFYFFFESRGPRGKKDPVVIWLSGGPGCSSSLALFYENGPYHVSSSDLSLSWNDYGWDKISNIIFVDQPIGTGFSYSDSLSDVPSDETGVSNDLYNFLQAFFTKHSDLAKNDFFITGESYAGHYIPALASRINAGNKAKKGIHINLKGFAIGNGLTDPEIQYPAYADYALSMKLIDQSEYDDVNSQTAGCVEEIRSCQTDTASCSNAYSTCGNIMDSVVSYASASGQPLNYYDVRKTCQGPLCYDFSGVEKLLNLASVKKALGVGDIEFVSCSSAVYSNMQNDWMKDLEVGIPALLEDGIKALIYAGEYDLICNWLGNWKWVHAMRWSGQKRFAVAKNSSFVVDRKEAGVLKSYGPLSFLKIHNAGHMVPMDQPKASLQMLDRWMKGTIANGVKSRPILP